MNADNGASMWVEDELDSSSGSLTTRLRLLRETATAMRNASKPDNGGQDVGGGE